MLDISFRYTSQSSLSDASINYKGNPEVCEFTHWHVYINLIVFKQLQQPIIEFYIYRYLHNKICFLFNLKFSQYLCPFLFLFPYLIRNTYKIASHLIRKIVVLERLQIYNDITRSVLNFVDNCTLYKNVYMCREYTRMSSALITVVLNGHPIVNGKKDAQLFA